MQHKASASESWLSVDGFEMSSNTSEESNAALKSRKSSRPDSKSGSDSAAVAEKKEPEGFRWGIMFIILLFVGAPIFSGVQYIFDKMNPEAAAKRVIYENVYKCYNAVGDIEKLNSVDTILKKYEGSERKLYSALRNKYGHDFPECDTFSS